MLKLPITNIYNYSYDIELENNIYTFFFKWNKLANTFSLFIQKEEEMILNHTLLFLNRWLINYNNSHIKGDIILIPSDPSIKESFTFNTPNDFYIKSQLFYVKDKADFNFE